MFDISERSAQKGGEGEGGRWIDRWRFAPSSSKRPFSSPLLPLLEMRFHANLSLRKLSRVFTLPSRWSRASLHVNHAQPPDIFPPSPSPPPALPRSNACHADPTPNEWIPLEDEIGNLKIGRFSCPLSLPPSIFLLDAALGVFFSFLIDFWFNFKQRERERENYSFWLIIDRS